MTAQGEWRVLALHSDRVPQLLVKATLSELDGYNIKVTDLSSIWGETLSKAQATSKAAETRCSIDPSEDVGQYKILLAKLESALACEAGTTVKLSESSQHENGLLLNVTATLPKPLTDLRWSFELQPLPARALADEVVTPLLHQSRSLHLQTQQLMQELREKDRVISKIVDRLEQSGNDLTTVFPGVSNVTTKKRNGSQRDQLARYVRGLGDFDEDVWRAQHGAIAASIDSLEPSEMNDVLRSLPSAVAAETESDWRRHVNEVQSAGNGARLERGRPSQNDGEDGVDDAYVAMAQDDGFQRQVTPPPTEMIHPPPQRKASVTEHANTVDSAQQGLHGDSTTEDDDDLDAPPAKVTRSTRNDSAQTQMAKPAPSRPARKLGAVEGCVASAGTKATEQLPSTISDSSPPAKSSSRNVRASVTPEAPAVTPAKPKLGAFGGKRKAAIPVPEEPKPDFSEAIGPLQSVKPTKLGAFGGKERERDEPVPVRSAAPVLEPAPRSATPIAKTPVIEMTEEEKANVKRDQLRKDMEAKAKAPAKKKRKF